MPYMLVFKKCRSLILKTCVNLYMVIYCKLGNKLVPSFKKQGEGARHSQRLVLQKCSPMFSELHSVFGATPAWLG